MVLGVNVKVDKGMMGVLPGVISNKEAQSSNGEIVLCSIKIC